MWKYTIQVDGMMCGMCESHVNDAVRKAFPVKKVTSSRSKKETVVITEMVSSSLGIIFEIEKNTKKKKKTKQKKKKKKEK